jgi:hypothetical protein
MNSSSNIRKQLDPESTLTAQFLEMERESQRRSQRRTITISIIAGAGILLIIAAYIVMAVLQETGRL